MMWDTFSPLEVLRCVLPSHTREVGAQIVVDAGCSLERPDWKGQRLVVVSQQCGMPGRIQAATCADGRFSFRYINKQQSGAQRMIERQQHICRVGTARIDYRGQDGQRVLDTTVKSGTGLGAVFAPTWDMVMQSKRNEIVWDEYRRQYTELMRSRYAANPSAFVEALHSDELIVCCYCRDTHTTTRHCHRYLLVEILEKVAVHHGIGFEVIGEVRKSQ